MVEQANRFDARINKAFIRKKYIRSIDAFETTRRTNGKERDKFSSGVRYGFKQRSNEMQKDNSSVGRRYSNIEEKSGIVRVFHSQFPLPYKNRIDVLLCFSVSVSPPLLFPLFIRTQYVCTYWQTSWPLFLLPVPLIIYHDRYRRLRQAEKETS